MASASASTAMTKPTPSGGPWLDGDDVSNLSPAITAPVATSSLLFLVSANNGIPFIRDPRSGWANLRNVANSSGGYVQNITIGQLTTTTMAGPQIVRVTARTSAGIFKTDCRIDVKPIPTSGAIPVPSAGISGCTAWTTLPVTG
ncbi:hypothetical protein GCM10023194_66590 [Planotetraspora phitsanulokensis]